MQLTDRIEKRRFVGREFLLLLWFESELFEATLSTETHGPFGLWLERQLVLSAGAESTRIKAATPGAGREAKEALLRGQLPESAGLRIAWRDDETSLVFKAEQMALSGLKLKAVLGKEEAPTELMKELQPAPRPRMGRGRQREEPSDEAHEAFYERMQLTREVEQLFETLYRDFLTLRLGESWANVAGMLYDWAEGRELDADDYRALRNPKARAARADARKKKRA
jgi:hypothetical protein